MLHACLDIKGTVLDKMHYLLYFLTPAMNPRYLCLIDQEDGKLIKGTVRVGMAVETVGQAGRPKTITGFQVSVLCALLNASAALTAFETRRRFSAYCLFNIEFD